MKDAAFPQTSYNEGGMTLRDYFAGQTMAAVASHVIGIDSTVLKSVMELYKCDTVEGFAAKLSYMYADAMLEQRKC